MDQKQIRDDIKKIRDELHSALRNLKGEAASKLSSKDWAEVEKEFSELDEILKRLETGLVWVTLFGKTSTGKSSIINSLLGQDKAPVGIEHDLTKKANSYEQSPWMLVDVPGVMGDSEMEAIAIEEAKKAHGHIFVINGEPDQEELKRFTLVNNACPNTPKIVFVNKWDMLEAGSEPDELETVKEKIKQKMRQFIKYPDLDIIYGSAMIVIKDQQTQKNKKVRQKLKQLEDRLYNEAGTLGVLMNLLDPAKRADDLNEKIHNKIWEVRTKIARKVINAFGVAAIAGAAIPFDGVTVVPGLLLSMTVALYHIVGGNANSSDAKRIAEEIAKTCAGYLVIEFGIVIAGSMVADLLGMAMGPAGYLISSGAQFAGLSYFKYQRTVVFGEVVLAYIRNGFSWGADGPQATIKRAKQNAEANYFKLQNRKPALG